MSFYRINPNKENPNERRQNPPAYHAGQSTWQRCAGTAEEVRKLQQALHRGEERDLFAHPAHLPAARISDLLTELRAHQPHILHFTGHGDGSGSLLLHAPDDQREAILTAPAPSSGSAVAQRRYAGANGTIDDNSVGLAEMHPPVVRGCSFSGFVVYLS